MYPKQFLKLAGMESSIFQLTLNRALLLTTVENIIFVTSEQYMHLICGQMEELGIQPIQENILCEPTPKNTLPAITYAVRHIKNRDLAVVFSSDHVVDNEQLLIETIGAACDLAKQYIITFGIKPTAPETVYGYIKPGKEVSPGFEIEAFAEKPDRDTALRYIDNGYLWNSGMFMFDTDIFMKELRVRNSEVYNAFICDTVEECFAKSPSISIDYGLMENCSIGVVLPMDIGWSDLGNFIAFYNRYRTDISGNINFHNEIVIDGTRNLVYSDGDRAIALMGLSDVVLVDQKDALLVCDRRSTGKIRDVVEILKERGDKRADHHITEYRSWGSFTLLEAEDNYKVVRLTVSPGKNFVYKKHYHRNEHWTVVKGTAIATIDGKDIVLSTGEGIGIQPGSRHGLCNPGKELLEVIEVQSGSCLGEENFAE